MTAITDEIERLGTASDSWPMVRGLLVGALVGVTVAGVVVLALTVQARRSAHRQRPTPPPLGTEPTP